MLSPSRIERINGHFPTASYDGTVYTAVCECCCGVAPEFISNSGRSEKAALAGLLDEVLRVHGRIVIERQKWACSDCGRVVPLQVDHIHLRSHGRDDRVSNLRGLCQEDHGEKHVPRIVHSVDLEGTH